MKALRRYFVAGLLVWIPLELTFLVIRFAVRQMDKTLALIPEKYRLEQLLGLDFQIPGLGVILTLLILLLTGMLVANIFGRALVRFGESLMERIPFVRSIYSAAKNFAEIIFSDSSDAFKNVLLIEYPRKGIYSLAFQTANELGEVQERTGSDVIGCFVPTTPNPTSGFIVMLPRQDVRVLDMEVDEALKMIISLGVVVPTWPKDPTGELPFRPRDDAG